MMQHYKNEESNRHIRDSLDPVKERYKDLQQSILATAATPLTQTEPANPAQPTELTFASLVLTAPLQIHSVADASNPQRAFVAPFVPHEQKSKVRRIKLIRRNVQGVYRRAIRVDTIGSARTISNTMSEARVQRQLQIVCRACFKDGVNVPSVENFSLSNLKSSVLRR